MAPKKIKKAKKKEDLPSFLLETLKAPQNISYPLKTVKSVHYLGPIFFGCHENQPVFHRLNLGISYDIHKTASSTENILRDAFRVPSATKKYSKIHRKFNPSGKPNVLFSDPYLHKCPGVRKIFVPGPPSAIDLGETESTIDGEASQEIPVYYIREKPDGSFDGEYELIELSEIWERKRIYMPEKERMAHPHFPKQFVTLKVIGPTIPGAITITKLPSKRRTDSQLDLEIKGKTNTKKGTKEATVKVVRVIEPKTEEENLPNPKDVPSAQESTMGTIKSDSVVKTESEINQETDQQKVHSENDITEIDEEDAKEHDEDDMNAAENEAMDEVPAEEKPED